jgi:hypothetical protein
MGVPVRVEDDNGVGGLQVEAKTSGSCRQQEDEVVRVGHVKDFEHISALVALGHTIQSEKFVALEVEIVLYDGHALGHLAEHQNLRKEKVTQLLYP